MRSLTLKHSNWLMGWGRGDLSTEHGLLAAAAADAGRGKREECSTPRGVLARRAISSR